MSDLSGNTDNQSDKKPESHDVRDDPFTTDLASEVENAAETTDASVATAVSGTASAAEAVDPDAVRHTSEQKDDSPQAHDNQYLTPDTGPEISHFLKTEVNTETSVGDAATAADASAVAQGVGRMLRNARMARKLSVDDVSRQLRISVQQVEAIEKEDFDQLPGRTFVRGFVRNYASLMQLDAHAILKMLPGPATMVAHVEHTPFKVQEMLPSSRERKGGGNLVQIIVILSALGAIGYFLYQKLPFFQSGEETVAETVTEPIAQQESSGGTVELQLALPSLNLSAPPGGAMQLDTDKKPSAPGTQANIAGLNTIGTLVLNFTGDTHVRVVDGNDDVIFEQNNIRGTQQRVSGKRPLSVVIDDAAAVELNYNDRTIDTEPYTHPTEGGARLMLE